MKDSLNSSSNSSNESICSECSNDIKNIPIDNKCKICKIPICICCGCYTSNYEIYCKKHISYISYDYKEISKGHYYNSKLKTDFFTQKLLK